MFGDHDGYVYRPVVHTLKIAFPGTVTTGGETIGTTSGGTTILTGATDDARTRVDVDDLDGAVSMDRRDGRLPVLAVCRNNGGRRATVQSSSGDGPQHDRERPAIRRKHHLCANRFADQRQLAKQRFDLQSCDDGHRVGRRGGDGGACARIDVDSVHGPVSVDGPATSRYTWERRRVRANLYSADLTSQGATVTNLPTNGSMVYVRLWSLTNGTWRRNDYKYTAATREQRHGSQCDDRAIDEPGARVVVDRVDSAVPVERRSGDLQSGCMWGRPRAAKSCPTRTSERTSARLSPACRPTGVRSTSDSGFSSAPHGTTATTRTLPPPRSPH